MTVMAPPLRGPRLLAALHSLNRAIDAPIDIRPLVPLRVALGPIVLMHLTPFVARLVDGETYRNTFHVPFAAWYPELPESLYGLALGLGVVAALAMSAGLLTRFATAYAACFVGYNLFLTKTHFHHNRAFLLVLLIGLALLPVGNSFSLDAWLARRRGRPLQPTGVRWPLMLLRFQVAAVYVASGFSKLIDGDWWGGVVTQLRVERFGQAAVDAGVPAPLVDLAATAGFHSWFAKIVIITELAIGIGLLVPRVRLAAVWLALMFHLAIELFASVEVFSFAAIAALVIWVTPMAHDRLLRTSPRLARVVALLDWTSRFRVKVPPDSAAATTVVDRDGADLSGSSAAVLVLSRLPVSFAVAAPLRALRVVSSSAVSRADGDVPPR